MDRRLALVMTILVSSLLSASTDVRKELRAKRMAARAALVSTSGATVASATFDPSGRCMFSHVPPGEYKVVLTSDDGRTVTIGDLDGDGQSDLYVAGGLAPAQDFNTTRGNKLAQVPDPTAGPGGQKAQDYNSSRSNRTALAPDPSAGPGNQKVADHNSSRSNKSSSAVSGLPTGQRMHKPFSCVAGWDGKVKGPFSEAAARASASSSQAPPEGACVVKVHCPSPSTVQIESWSFGASPSGR